MYLGDVIIDNGEISQIKMEICILFTAQQVYTFTGKFSANFEAFILKCLK
jgi:hypothetical protein